MVSFAFHKIPCEKHSYLLLVHLESNHVIDLTIIDMEPCPPLSFETQMQLPSKSYKWNPRCVPFFSPIVLHQSPCIALHSAIKNTFPYSVYHLKVHEITKIIGLHPWLLIFVYKNQTLKKWLTHHFFHCNKCCQRWC